VIDRRAFVAGLATLVAARVAGAQPARKLSRIGILSLGMTADHVGPEPRSPITQGFLRGLRELGYVYGENFTTAARGAESRPERYAALAAELIELPVDVIVAPGPMLPALKQATSTLPIVMAGAIDPVGEGLVRVGGRSATRPPGAISIAGHGNPHSN